MSVVNPYARELTFPDSHDADAAGSHEVSDTHPRDCALLHQHQRPDPQDRPWRGKTVSYIEVTLDDIDIGEPARA